MNFKSIVKRHMEPELGGALQSFPERFEDWLDHHCVMSPIKHIERKYNENDPTGLYLSDFLRPGSTYGKPMFVGSCDPREPVFISAPTGCGKNVFMKRDILGPLLEKNKVRPVQEHERVLLLGNRVALGRQTKLDIAEFIRERTGNSTYYSNIDCIKSDAQDAIDRQNDFGDILIYSYQQISSALDSLSDKNIKYVVFDECHFFCSDAVFNPKTHIIAEKLVFAFQKSIRIYMSSTMETVFEPIIRREVDAYQRQIKHTVVDARLPVKYYDVSREYDYLNIRTWKEQEELINRIIESKGKWLIFVASKDAGDDLKVRLNDKLAPSIGGTTDASVKGNKPAEFITAADKNNKVYKNIVTDEKIPDDVKVLITTAVIDNGVNIKDKKVANIVIDVPDRVEFIQMLGRLRIDGDFKGKINLYIRDFSLKTIKDYWRRDMVALIDRVEYMQNNILPLNEQPHIIDVASDSEINELSIYQLLTRIEDLSRMIKAIEPSCALVLTESERDRQLKAINWILYGKNNRNYLSRRICSVLKDVMMDIAQPDRQKGGVIYEYPKLADYLSEKSFLRIIQEKRASALEYDAMEFTEKTLMGTKYSEIRGKRKREIFKVGIEKYSYTKPVGDSLMVINNYNNMVNGTFYSDGSSGRYEYFKHHLPDYITDMPWEEADVWGDLKKAQIISEGEQELPDAEYMEEKYNKYQKLSQNELGSKSPVIMEQLHWLDMTDMSRIEREVEAGCDDNHRVQEPFDKAKVDALLEKYSIPLQETTDIVKGNKQPPDGKKKNDWIRCNGYDANELDKIIVNDSPIFKSSAEGLSANEIRKMFTFFKDHY